MNEQALTSWGDVQTAIALGLSLAAIRVLSWIWDRISARFEPVTADC